MVTPRQTILLVALVLGVWSACPAQSSSGWSFWGTADGMNESYTSSVAVHNENVWIKHGSVDRMNLFDGYGMVELPDPGYVGKIHTSPDGTLWAWTGQQLSRYRKSRWESFK